jgi:hypothetical protein
MNARSLILLLTLAGVAVLGCPQPGDAHRLDEYLQAAKLSVERGRVVLDLDLTPGVTVAPLVFSLIDTNGDGHISPEEAEAYEQQVLHSVVLLLDGSPLSLRPVSAHFPEYREMTAGVGVVRLVGAATFTPSGSGNHQLFFRNTHQPKIGAYLANALLPADNRVEIDNQWRDVAQHELTIDYRVTQRSRPSGWWIVIALLAAGLASLMMWQMHGPAKDRAR